MKLALVSAFSILTFLTACTTTTPSSQPTIKGVHVQDSNLLAKDLKNYYWSYLPSGSNQPIVLHFLDKSISVDTGCNVMNGAWQINDKQLVVGKMMSTLKMCAPELMKQEGFAAKLLQDHSIPVSLDRTDPQQPILTLTHTDGEKYQFIGKATPEFKYQSKPDIIFMEVAAETKACTGVATQQCLQVREIKYNESFTKTTVGDWQLFYDHIEGFKHDPNVRTVLRLKRFTIANPAADQSKYAYIHDLTVEQEMVK